MAKGAYSSLSPAQKAKFHKVMHEFGQGKLKASYGKKITKQDEAVAIAFSEARRMR